MENSEIFNKSLKLNIFKSKFLFKILPKTFVQFSLLKKISLIFRSLKGYTILYYTIQNEIVAYVFLKRNYLRKYGFLKKHNLLVNPIFTVEKFRRGGVAVSLLQDAIKWADENHISAIYAVINKDNIASIRAHEKAGFVKKGCIVKVRGRYQLTDHHKNLYLFSNR